MFHYWKWAKGAPLRIKSWRLLSAAFLIVHGAMFVHTVQSVYDYCPVACEGESSDPWVQNGYNNMLINERARNIIQDLKNKVENDRAQVASM